MSSLGNYPEVSLSGDFHQSPAYVNIFYWHLKVAMAVVEKMLFSLQLNNYNEVNIDTKN